MKAVLPYISRLLPLLDLGLGHAQSSSATNELRENVTALQSTQRDLRVSVQDQTLQLKRVEENLTRMREVSEKNAFEHAELVEDVKSIGNLVRVVGAGLAILLIVLILMVGALLAHVSHY
jgi:cell division protein FtsX